MGEKLQTIAFIDLVGSTGVYQAAGTAKAAEVITQITQWISRVVQAHDGEVIKFMGDGVLARFAHSRQAVEALVFLQRNHSQRLLKWPPALRMSLKIGAATGSVIDTGYDTLGDALNLASRLSNMSGANAIWVTGSIIQELRGANADFDNSRNTSLVFDGVRFRSLGMVPVRGLMQPQLVYQVEWNEALPTDLMTVRGALTSVEGAPAPDDTGKDSTIHLQWLGQSRRFVRAEMPIAIGRAPTNDFILSDPRVSREHGRLEWLDGVFMLTDTSSFGTWVRFANDRATEIQLRRTQCILHSSGEITLGAPFSDFSAPTMSFRVEASQQQPGLTLEAAADGDAG